MDGWHGQGERKNQCMGGLKEEEGASGRQIEVKYDHMIDREMREGE